MRTLIFCALAICALSIPAQAEIIVHDARVKLGIGQRPSVLHGRITNHSNTPTRLIGAESDSFARIELHTHETHSDGMMRMKKVDSYVLPANGSVILKPAADHLMLFGFSGTPNDMVAVTLHFADGRTARIEAKAVARQKRKKQKRGWEKHDH